MNWCLIESDPSVFTSLLHSLNIPSLEVMELYTTQSSPTVQTHGLIFLFKYSSVAKTSSQQPSNYDNIYFAQQIVSNACATLSLLHILLNLSDSVIDSSSVMTNFKEFTLPLSPDMRGLALSNSDDICKAHNAFTKPQLYILESADDGKGDAYHFIAFIEKDGAVWELDGLQEGPIHHGNIQSGQDWTAVALKVIEEKIAKIGGVEYALMAVVDSELEKLRKLKEMGVEGIDEALAAEENKREKRKIENERRKWNFVPAIMRILEEMGKEGKL